MRVPRTFLTIVLMVPGSATSPGLATEVRRPNTIVILTDGKPGGVGLDYDLSNVPPPSKDADPTFAQFVFNPLARGVLFTCFFCGVAAFWLSMSAVNPAALHGWAIVSLIVKLVLTILGTLAASVVMAVLHVPSGH